MKKNKNIIVLVFSFLSFVYSSYAQTPTLDWVKQLGSSAADYGYSVAVHSNGNIYTTGFFTGTVDFNPDPAVTYNLTADSTDIFIYKLDSNGVFQWAKRMGGPTSGDAGYSIALDANENAYITGTFKGTANFNPSGTALNLTSAGGFDIFVAKFNSSGTIQWAKKMGGSKDDIGYSIAIDASGDVYTTGWFTGTSNFNPNGTLNFTASGTITISNTYPTDIFVSKLKTDGTYIWAKQMGGTQYDFGFSITLDASKNVFTTGGFQGSSDFDPSSTSHSLSSAGGIDIYVSKLDATGAYVWAQKMGGPNDDFGNSITLDKSGNILTTGAFEATADFDPSSSTKNITASGANNVFDIFISKLNASGGYIWAKGIGGTGDDAGLSIAVDTSGNVYTTGGFQNTADFNKGSSPAKNFTAQGSGIYDMFISKLDPSGAYIWTEQFGGVADDGGQCITLDTYGTIYTIGGFKKTVDFDPTAATYNLTADSIDVFILKLKQPAPCITTTPTVTVSNACGNSTLTASASTGTYLWSPGGQTTNPITVTSAGTYSVTITKNGCASNVGTGTAAPLTVPTTPSVTVSDACGSSTLTSSTTSGTYLWSPGGQTTNPITVTSAGSYSVIVTQNGCTSASGVGTAAPKTIPATPTISVSNTCGLSTLTSSTTTGTYLWSPNGETTQSINVTTAATFSATVTESGCISAAGTATSAPIAIPAAPGVNSPISYCQNTTASQLTATGTSLLWYTVASGGSGSSTAPTPLTTTIGQTNYYVSQTVNACESDRALITINVTAGTAAPTVVSPVNYCLNASASPLTATGTNLSWYSNNTDPNGSGSSTAPTPLTTTIGTVSYFVSQTQCGEGPRAQIDVITNAIPAAPAVSVIDSCSKSTLTAGNFTGNLLWSTNETSTSITVTNAATYSVTQTVNGCTSSTYGTGTSSPIPAPSSPSVTSPVEYCQNATATALTATGTGLMWYYAATGGAGSSTAITPSTANIGSTDYFVSQTVNACEGSRATISVNINAIPAPPVVVTPIAYCQNGTASPLTATGSNLLWYNAASGGVGSTTATTPSTTNIGSSDYYVSQTVNSCESNRADITVNVTSTTPAPTVTSPVSYCENSTATPLTATGTNLLWYSAATGGTGSATAPTPSTTTSASYYVSQDLCGEGPRAQIAVNINPIPTITVNSITICAGQAATLTASGGTSYLWSDSETTASISFIPTASTSYTVTGTLSGCSASAIATIDMCTGIGIVENTNAQDILIYPNPNDGEFTISISHSNFNSVNIAVVDMIGNEVYSVVVKNNGDDFSKQIKLDDLSSGIYFVRLNIGTEVIIKKLIIQ